MLDAARSRRVEPLKTSEDYQLSMDALVKGADDRALTEDEIKQYEDLEKAKLAIRATEEIRKRNTAYQMPRVAIVPGLPAGVKERDSEEYAWDRYLRGRNPLGSDLHQDLYA